MEITSQTADIDWEGLERYFIENTPADMTLRRFADELTPELEESNHTRISYEIMREVAKVNHWLDKRAKYLTEKFPSLYTDAAIQYSMLMDRWLEMINDQISPRDLVSMTTAVAGLRDTLLSRDSSILGDDSDQKEQITRDKVVEIINNLVELDRRRITSISIEMLEDVTGPHPLDLQDAYAPDEETFSDEELNEPEAGSS